VGFFTWRRKRESAIPESANQEALGSFANAEGQPVVGQQLGGGQPSIDLSSMSGLEGLQALMQVGPMIQRAMATGNVQISQGEPQVLDMRGSGLREEILGIMKAHGLDPEGQTPGEIDASAYGDMQKQILEALSRHGIDPGASGTSINFQISTDDEAN